MVAETTPVEELQSAASPNESDDLDQTMSELEDTAEYDQPLDTATESVDHTSSSEAKTVMMTPEDDHVKHSPSIDEVYQHMTMLTISMNWVLKLL